MELKQALGQAIKELRISKELSQETVGASQSYVSDVERGIKSPTVIKLVELAENMGVHPLTVLAKSYLLADPNLNVEKLLEQLRQELDVP
ncbi:transcriptional regulator [Pseudomonas tohonis]|uniref:Transcriptional regulator n=1 Tax=Pseudomonas tohonis TaxID=2725477 RepID=A0A6J4E7L1_9PSED|nr:helix-turn-helix transcriptional regulator [Pseudomonas tohonis]BCG25226.1 transcriptional regulator [Pseudomonas tohonis]GJN54368.1 transcriptional regulator [Pseudomonas tohonis]